jgi:hypothetical protein
LEKFVIGKGSKVTSVKLIQGIKANRFDRVVNSYAKGLSTIEDMYETFEKQVFDNNFLSGEETSMMKGNPLNGQTSELTGRGRPFVLWSKLF